MKVNCGDLAIELEHLGKDYNKRIFNLGGLDIELWRQRF